MPGVAVAVVVCGATTDGVEAVVAPALPVTRPAREAVSGSKKERFFIMYPPSFCF
jgi:hypothetical protein